MKEKISLTLLGAHAAAYAMKQINPDVVAAYPITPQTPIMERFSEYVADGLVNTEMILVESEHSAMSACVGASAAGARVMTATSSVGLALMTEIVFIASSMRLPIVMNVVNRALSGNINIHGDHSDSMLVRDSGWVQLYSENAQEVYENNIFAIKFAEKYKVPVMVMQDGFITSHALENVFVLKDEDVKSLIGENKRENTLLNSNLTIGPLDLFDYYFEHKYQQIELFETIRKEFNKEAEQFSKETGYGMYSIENYMVNDAEFVLMCMNSTAGIVKEVVDELREQGYKVGCLKFRLFRPFPTEDLRNIIKFSNVKMIGVLDRAISVGSSGPLNLEVKNALFGYFDGKIYNFIYGLGGRDVTKDQIKNAFMMLIETKGLEELNFLGLRK
ncbi:MAG: pyruvate ferredoxin oxidoreductase [Candidatus Woesearchaeota archaeon]